MASQWEYIKWIPGTKLMIDGFRFQNPACKSYLLTHYHSDHTTGLTRSFTAGLIFCTPITAKLLRSGMRIPSERICPMQLDQPLDIEGTEVTPIDANHCPGACMFLLKIKDRSTGSFRTLLHTGDLRWDDKMALHPALKGQAIDALYLDTTYAKPIHTHPHQDICIRQMADIMKRELADNPKTLFVVRICCKTGNPSEIGLAAKATFLTFNFLSTVGSYHIGKERAYLGAAKLLGWKVWVDSRKQAVLKMLELPEDLMSVLTTVKDKARIHVDFLGGLQPEKLQKSLSSGKWTQAIGFRPTGWTFRRSGKLDIRREGDVKIYGIPYSEHSSFTELRACVAALKPKKLVPTVNATNAAAARAIINRFADLMDLSGDRSRLDFFMRQPSTTTCDDSCCPSGSSCSEAEPPCGGVSGNCQPSSLVAKLSSCGSFSDDAKLKSCGSVSCCERGGRAESDGSSCELLALQTLESIDVAEQERIWLDITEERKRRTSDLSKCLMQKRQATLMTFLKK